MYTYTPPSKTTTTAESLTGGVFTPSTTSAPTSFLSYQGRWGDAEYPDSDERQKGKGLFGFKKYVGGPTGVEDKQLMRKEVWPENEFSKGQKVRRKVPGVGLLGCFGKGEAKKLGMLIKSKGKGMR